MVVMPSRKRNKFTLPPFHLFGIAIHIHNSWFLIVAFMTWRLGGGYFPVIYQRLEQSTCWLMGFASALLLFLCVLLHELGHSLVAKAHGIAVPRITLFILGGIAQIASDPKRPLTEFKIAVAGPLVSAVISATCYWFFMVLPVHSLSGFIVIAILHYLALMNLFLIIFNMLPGFPLDGGRVLRSIIWGLTGNVVTATRITSSMGAGLGVSLWVLGAWWIVKGDILNGVIYILIGTFLRNAAKTSLSQVEHLQKRRLPRSRFE